MKGCFFLKRKRFRYYENSAQNRINAIIEIKNGIINVETQHERECGIREEGACKYVEIKKKNTRHAEIQR
jgi:hypothetical protein